MDAGLNCLVMLFVPTVRFAVLLTAPATGVSAELTPEVVFGWTPCVLLVTSKITVQLPVAGMVMPVKVSDVSPELRVLGLAPQVPVTLPPSALIPTSVSLKVAAVNGKAFVFASVKVTCEVPPGVIEVGLKALAIVGAPATVRVAVLLGLPAVGV